MSDPSCSSGLAGRGPGAPPSEQQPVIVCDRGDLAQQVVGGCCWESPLIDTQGCVCVYGQREPEALGPCWPGSPYVYYGCECCSDASPLYTLYTVSSNTTSYTIIFFVWCSEDKRGGWSGGGGGGCCWRHCGNNVRPCNHAVVSLMQRACIFNTDYRDKARPLTRVVLKRCVLSVLSSEQRIYIQKICFILSCCKTTICTRHEPCVILSVSSCRPYKL